MLRSLNYEYVQHLLKWKDTLFYKNNVCW